MLVGYEVLFKLCDFGICGTLKDSVSSTHLGSMRYLPVRIKQFNWLSILFVVFCLKSLNVLEMFVHMELGLICGH